MPAQPLRTSNSPDELLRLEIAPGTPVYDTRHATAGQAVGVTNGYCLFQVDSQETKNSFSVTPWRDLAIGNIGPAQHLLPADPDQRDRLDTYAVLFRELTSVHPDDMFPALVKTLQELQIILTGTLGTKQTKPKP